MRRSFIVLAVALVTLPLCAQRHSGSPPTAPPRPPAPVVPVSSGMGNIQFVAVNYGVPAPQSLTRQLRIDDDRTRAAALSAIGAPSQYLQHGHVGMPRSVQLEFADLGGDDELDAILTVELDQHIVTAILVPDESNWRRVATLTLADSAIDSRNTPDSFVRAASSMLERGRYRAVFQALAPDGHGNYTTNEAQLRVVSNKALILISFVSASRDCTVPAAAPGSKPNSSTGCNILRRWLEPDPSNPYKAFILITGTGHLSAREAASPLGDAPDFEAAHLRTFSCQPFIFSDPNQHFDPTGPSLPCPSR